MTMELYAAIYILLIPFSYKIIYKMVDKHARSQFSILYTTRPSLTDKHVKMDKLFAMGFSVFWPLTLPITFLFTRIRKND